MNINLEKTINIGDLGIIYLMHWECESDDKFASKETYSAMHNSKENYFSVYYSTNFIEESKEFVTEMDDNGFVTKGSNLHMILSNYVEENITGVTERNQMFEDSADAVFNVFEKIHSRRKSLLK